MPPATCRRVARTRAPTALTRAATLPRRPAAATFPSIPAATSPARPTSPLTPAATSRARPTSPRMSRPACRTIATTATLTSHLKITADNECEVFVNGSRVGMTNNWGSAVTIDVSLYVHPGRKNVIAVRGTNTSSQGGNDRGIIGELAVDADGGSRRWSSPTPRGVREDRARRRCRRAQLDRRRLRRRLERGHRDRQQRRGPWGAVLSISIAKWIWSAPVPRARRTSRISEPAYARRTFYFALDGSTIATTPACP